VTIERLVVRLSDGSEHQVDLRGQPGETVVGKITGDVHGGKKWLPTVNGGKVRTKAIIALRLERGGD